MSRFRYLLAGALAVSLMTGSIAAQARDHDRDHKHRSHHEQRWDHGHDRHAWNRDERRWQRVERNHWNDRRDQRYAYARGYRDGRYDAGRYYHPVGYRAYSWHRGARLPAAYCAPRYVVSDYADYRLYRPPHGHHWIRVDHDVVLAAIATGAVVAVVNDLFY